MNYTETISRTEAELDRLLDKQSKLILRSIRKLEKNIIDLAVEILPVQAGEIKSTNTSLARAVKFHKELIKEFNRFNGVWEQAVDGYTAIERAVLKEYADLDIPISWTTADQKMFGAMRETMVAEFSHFAEATLDQMAQKVYDAVLVGRPFSELIIDFQAMLTGYKDVAGRSMIMYAETKAHDALMGYYARVNQTAADDAGVNSMLYYGNIVKESRAFCIARAGRVFTIEQIKAWDALQWAGKKPGPTLINRGGYRCRHSLHPVMQEWVEDGQIELQNWHKEKA